MKGISYAARVSCVRRVIFFCFSVKFDLGGEYNFAPNALEVAGLQIICTAGADGYF